MNFPGNYLNNRWRIKHYQLSDDGSWNDKGTGLLGIYKEVMLFILHIFVE